jgi:hypothetical protein
MKDNITTGDGEDTANADEHWLNLESVAEIEITSEDPEHPIDSAIGAEDHGDGWHAFNPGEQIIRICFHQPQKLTRIRLDFKEPAERRTQQFTLSWEGDNPEDIREIVRQQFNFSPPNSTREFEDYKVSLDRVRVLTLRVVPDLSREDAYATLSRLRLA